MNVFSILESYNRNGTLGELTGKSPVELEPWFRQEYAIAREKFETAIRETAKSSRPVSIDASRLSGVNGGDQWFFEIDGRIGRKLDLFPEVESLLLANTPPRAAQPASLLQARPLLTRAAYNGLWSPSGTNWQPIRSVELGSEELHKILPQSEGSCGLLVLARKKYDSILGDVATLCGVEQASYAESIDLGIWLAAAETTAGAHGWRLRSHRIESHDRKAVTRLLQAILEERATKFPQPYHQPAQNLLSSLCASDHYPAWLLIPFEGTPLTTDNQAPGLLRPSTFDRLVESRSTQRVASLSDLDPAIVGDIFQQACSSHPPVIKTQLHFATFHWQEQFPELVGRAMHAGIEGPEGLLNKTSVKQFQCYFSRLLSEAPHLTRGISEKDVMNDTRVSDLALPSALIPAHIRFALIQGGQYRIEHDILLDHRDHPLTTVRLMKLVRMMARSFGRFFLSFQNTHPVLGILAVPPTTDPDADRLLYQTVGRTVALMTFLARARGLVSIIKSGPIEIARAAIGDLLKEYAPDERTRRLIGGEGFRPILTFQVGLPLGPNELVSAGRPDEHNGLKERLLDRRAPRASLLSHYIPAPEQS